jgi:hypothetical protein
VSVLNHLAQAAAVILLAELLVVLLIFAALAGGLAFGLRWGRGKLRDAFEKGNSYLPLLRTYVHTGTDYVAKPLIAAGKVASTVKGTALAIRKRFRESRFSGRTTQTAFPIAEAPPAPSLPAEPASLPATPARVPNSTPTS